MGHTVPLRDAAIFPTMSDVEGKQTVPRDARTESETDNIEPLIESQAEVDSTECVSKLADHVSA